ncbi:MAG: M1 family metallopeptidase, partial [Flavobacteriales bacterium]|nr:M1 family metallopeptidase [Flavobacteriales bacterium]
MKLTSLFAFVLIASIGVSQNNICQYYKQHKKMSPTSFSSTERSDTIDILNYHIDLNILDFSGQTISGFCTIDFTPKQTGISSISLDLLSFTIDSITQNGTQLTYSYNDTLLVANLDNTYNIADTTSLTIYYAGQSQKDPSGWGGFYFQSGYAFNLGVGFESVPHNYGRAWFPCFDNFVERSTYSFNIKTSNGKVAMCNGLLTNETVISGDTISREWIINDQIPTYLAGVAVTNYTTIYQTHSGIDGPIPIELYAKSTDTNGVKNSFVNLGGAIEAFENAFGPYRWDKVGYSMVPFNSGAMEHATNIAYPLSAANGSLTYETLMAHELSHHWWGNLATCHVAEEMWINEGMARYSEALFLEHQYGRDAYEDDINANHLYVIRYPQHFEGGFLSLDNIPLEYTYGDHVYLKGADVAHTLRGYLGDSLYFDGLTQFLENHQFTDVSNIELQDGLTTYTGVDLSDFFEGWVLNPGFPEFETRQFSSTPNGGEYDVTVGVAQKLKGAPSYFNNVPLDITFMDENWVQHTEKITMSGNYKVFDLTIPIDPVYATIDFNNLISDAITDDKIIIANSGTYNLENALMTITIEDPVDSAFLRIEHMWVAPDPIEDPNMKYQLSTSRYYR